MKTIPLTQGKFALVDDADYEAVMQFKWHARKKGRKFYAARSFKKPDGKYSRQFLHQFLMPGVAEIDHRDGDGLNNQRGNLRPATAQQNRWGFRLKAIGKTSRYRGVSWCRRALKWVAQISVDGRKIRLGYFRLEKDAALCYDAAARKYFREFACPNFKN